MISRRTPALLSALLLGPSLAGGAQRPREPVPAASARATPADRLQQVRERRQRLEQELARMREQEKDLLGEVERLELLVRLRGAQLREAQLDLQRTSEKLEATARRLLEIERQIDGARPVLRGRARALYKLGELSYVRLLLSVDRPSDIFRGYRLVTQLARRDNERFMSFRAELQAQASARAELLAHTQQAETQRAAAERARRELDAQRRRKTQRLTEMVEKKELHGQYVRELEEAEARLARMLDGFGEQTVELPVAALRGSLPWPVAGRVRVPFGRRKDKHFDTYTPHNGIEIDAPADSPVAAVHEGSVVFADRFRGYGLMVVVDHGSKRHTLYAHLAEIRATTGQTVVAGTPLGTTGSALEGGGLYFEVRSDGRPEDPLDWLLSKRERH